MFWPVSLATFAKRLRGVNEEEESWTDKEDKQTCDSLGERIVRPREGAKAAAAAAVAMCRLEEFYTMIEDRCLRAAR